MTRHELADAMLKGLHTPEVEESKLHYIHIWPIAKICKACALGCAIIGKYEGDYIKAEEAADRLFDSSPTAYECELASEMLGISPSLAFEIEHKHLNGMSVQQIAAWLKTSEGKGNHD